VIVHLHVQVQVSPYPGNRSGQEVRQSRSKLLQSLRVEVDELRQDILKKKTGTPTPSFQHLLRFTRKKIFDKVFVLLGTDLPEMLFIFWLFFQRSFDGVLIAYLFSCHIFKRVSVL
jgi:hypothetical protein